MRVLEGKVLLSASDLMRFQGCPHATAPDLAHLRGDGPQPRGHSEEMKLFRKRGDAHEAAYLERLKTAGRSVVEVQRSDLVKDAASTRDLLAQGATPRSGVQVSPEPFPSL